MSRLLVLVALALVGCGGGDDVDRCTTDTSFIASVTWNSNGSIDTRVEGRIGVSLVATPTITGVPASCVSQMSFTPEDPLPAGLVLNKSTGVVTGIPTGPALSSSGDYVFLNVPGFHRIEILSIITVF